MVSLSSFVKMIRSSFVKMIRVVYNFTNQDMTQIQLTRIKPSTRTTYSVLRTLNDGARTSK